jgi:hypothetical protein
VSTTWHEGLINRGDQVRGLAAQKHANGASDICLWCPSYAAPSSLGRCCCWLLTACSLVLVLVLLLLLLLLLRCCACVQVIVFEPMYDSYAGMAQQVRAWWCYLCSKCTSTYS